MTHTKSIVKSIVLAGLIINLCLSVNAQQERCRYGLRKRIADYHYNLGRKEAQQDMRKGIYQIKFYGLPGDFDEMYHYALILRDEYNVKYDYASGCITNARWMNRYDGYNDYVSKITEMKFGKNIFNQVEKRAAEEHLNCVKLKTEVNHLFPYLPEPNKLHR